MFCLGRGKGTVAKSLYQTPSSILLRRTMGRSEGTSKKCGIKRGNKQTTGARVVVASVVFVRPAERPHGRRCPLRQRQRVIGW